MIKELCFATLAGVFLAGCCCNTCVEFKEVDADDYPVSAYYTPEKITIDGKLEEKVWQKAETCPLHFVPFFKGYGKALARVKQDKFQGAEVRFAYDKEYFYVAATLTDEDIVQFDDQPQQHSYKSGDAFELFLKPAGQPYYWEIYVTPQNQRSSFFYLGSGLPSSDAFGKKHFISTMRSAVVLNGSLNKMDDRDRGWTLELAIPIKDLAVKGVPMDGKAAWTVLPARYNYDKNFRHVQLSCYPPTPVAGNHLIEYYGKIQFK